jgi:CRISPR-associated protein Cas5d
MNANSQTLISKPVRLRVRGARACFTRSEFHVERVSYPVITPSAARGILEAILMKPVEKPEVAKRSDKSGFAWHVLCIGIVHRGFEMCILRNELGYESDTHGTKGYDISSSKNRAQRQSLILTGGIHESGQPRMIEYIIEAVIEVAHPHVRGSREFPIATYQKMFERRASKGQCYHRPYFGCREFPCEFELDPDAEPDKSINQDFGMLFRDFDFSPVWNHWQGGTSRPSEWKDSKGYPIVPRVLPSFHAIAEEGWIRVSRVVERGGRKEVVPND